MTTRGLFITGTDTGVGKTFVTCLIARDLQQRGYQVGVYKPACSGATRNSSGELSWDDVLALEQSVKFRFPSDRICPQRFEAPLAPPMAAKLEGRRVDSEQLRAGAGWWKGRVDVLLIEGAGGLLCPLTETESVADLAVQLGYPLLIVARRGLGTINHTLLTVEAAQRRGLTIAGILLNEAEPITNDPAVESNEREITVRCQIPVIGALRHGADTVLPGHECTTQVLWSDLASMAAWSK